MRDRFDVSLSNSHLKEKLQLIHDLNLSKASETAQQHEQIKDQMKQQGHGASSVGTSDETPRGRPVKGHITCK